MVARVLHRRVGCPFSLNLHGRIAVGGRWTNGEVAACDRRCQVRVACIALRRGRMSGPLSLEKTLSMRGRHACRISCQKEMFLLCRHVFCIPPGVRKDHHDAVSEQPRGGGSADDR